MTVDCRDMARRGRIGGFSRAAQYPGDELTSKARAGFLRRFIPNDPGLTEEEKQRRADCALRAYMARLSRLSALSRQKSKGVRHGQ